MAIVKDVDWSSFFGQRLGIITTVVIDGDKGYRWWILGWWQIYFVNFRWMSDTDLKCCSMFDNKEI